MGNRSLPLFVGPNAERAAQSYARYDFGERVLGVVENYGNVLRYRVFGIPQPLELIEPDYIDIEFHEKDYYSADDLFDFLVSIDGIGETTAESILSRYKDIQNLSTATLYTLCRIPKVGEKRAFFNKRL